MYQTVHWAYKSSEHIFSLIIGPDVLSVWQYFLQNICGLRLKSMGLVVLGQNTKF